MLVSIADLYVDDDFDLLTSGFDIARGLFSPDFKNTRFFE